MKKSKKKMAKMKKITTSSLQKNIDKGYTPNKAKCRAK